MRPYLKLHNLGFKSVKMIEELLKLGKSYGFYFIYVRNYARDFEGIYL